MWLRSLNTNIVYNENPPPHGKRDARDQRGGPKTKHVLNETNARTDNCLVDLSKSLNERLRITQYKENSRKSDSNDEIQVVYATSRADPCPGFDFDKQCARKHDEDAVPEFAFDIFEYLRSREKYFMVPDYIRRHRNYSPQIRARFVDWMVGMQETFELNHETLYLSVKLWDLYMAQTSETQLTEIDRQLIASVCIFVASKFDERSLPLIDDFVYVNQDQFKREEFMACERKLLAVVGFELGCPLSYVYLRRLARVTSAGIRTLTLSRYILETSLCYYEFVGVRESVLASGAFYLALRMEEQNARWTPVLHKYSGYSLAEIEPFVDELNLMLHRIRQGVDDEAKTVQAKYSHRVFYEVALIPLVPCKWENLNRRVMQGKMFNYQSPIRNKRISFS